MSESAAGAAQQALARAELPTIRWSASSPRVPRATPRTRSAADASPVRRLKGPSVLRGRSGECSCCGRVRRPRPRPGPAPALDGVDDGRRHAAALARRAAPPLLELLSFAALAAALRSLRAARMAARVHLSLQHYFCINDDAASTRLRCVRAAVRRAPACSKACRAAARLEASGFQRAR